MVWYKPSMSNADTLFFFTPAGCCFRLAFGSGGALGCFGSVFCSFGVGSLIVWGFRVLMASLF